MMRKFFLFINVILFSLVFAKAQEVDFKEIELRLRSIGHELLRQSGDSTSRVLPITDAQNGAYLISFEQPFAFYTDTLINIVNRYLNEYEEQGYRIRVLSQNSKASVYAYEVNQSSNFEIPCTGVLNPVDSYRIEVTIENTVTLKNTSYLYYFLVGFGTLSILILGVTKIKKPTYISHTESLGSHFVDTANKKLKNKAGVIELTEQEERLFFVLFSNLNKLVSRETLLYEIWEKEGVVVTSRSLDVLVSKLRKKLAQDETVKITNVHGKGYKLVVA